jgi:secretion/DNA translocation related TadE-like protein
MNPVHRQRGSVTIVVAAIMLVALVLCLGIGDLTEVLVVRSRVRWAADAAALAAAQELAVAPGADPAPQAAAYAAANGAEIVSCVCSPGTSEAVVEVRMPVGSLTLLPGARLAVARSRAIVEVPTPSPAMPASP